MIQIEVVEAEQRDSDRRIGRMFVTSFFQGPQLISVVLAFAVELLVIGHDGAPFVRGQQLHAQLGGAGRVVVLAQGKETLAQKHQDTAIGRIVDQRVPECAGCRLVLTGLEAGLSLGGEIGRGEVVEVRRAAGGCRRRIFQHGWTWSNARGCIG